MFNQYILISTHSLFEWLVVLYSYLMFLALAGHGERMVGELVRLALLGLHDERHRPAPLLALDDRLEVPGLVAAVGDRQVLGVLDSHTGGEVLALTRLWVADTRSCQGQRYWLVWTTLQEATQLL